MAYSLVVRKRGLTGILLTFTFAASAIPMAARAEVAGKAISVTGRVLVRNEKDPNTKAQFLKPGDELSPGAVINTDSAGAVKLLLNDKSIIDLGASTLFKVDEYKQNNMDDRRVGMTMAYGKIRASVNTPVSLKGKYQIRSKSVTMGVRGTEFIVMSDLASFVSPAAPPAGGAPGGAPPSGPAAGQTQVTVVHGKVVVEDEKAPPSQQPVALTAGTRLTVENKEDEAGRKLASDEQKNEEPKEPPKVETLTKEEVAQVKQEAKQEDKTFQRAVVIDSTNQGSGGDTLAALSDGMLDPSMALPAGDIGGYRPPPLPMGMNLNGMPVTLRVVFKK